MIDLEDRYAWPLLAAAAAPALLAWAALIGLGVVRQGDAWAVAAAASFLTFGPAILAGLFSPRPRLARIALVTTLWSVILLAALPVYFPGERREAVATGLALLFRDPEGLGMARTVADALPEEPEVAVAQAPEAEPLEAVALPPRAPLPEDAIELPYEGEGRRLSVTVVFRNQGREVETQMMLDTGATYTTLPPQALQALGALPGPGAPELTLNTANGEKTSKVVLLDGVFLGDLLVEGVAVTECADCATGEVAGLLGLNVTGGYNVTIDADRHLVVFAPRARFNRRLDAAPFVDLDARFVRYPGGRVEVEVGLASRATRALLDAAASVRCGDEAWSIALGGLPVGEERTLRRRLPSHDRCEMYQIELEHVTW